MVVNGKTYPLEAGKRFFFTGDFPDGVNSFSIRGIDPSEKLDPLDMRAFPVGITFMETGVSGDVLKAKPLSKRPSALTSSWGVGLLIALTLGGALIAGLVWWRKSGAG